MAKEARANNLGRQDKMESDSKPSQTVKCNASKIVSLTEDEISVIQTKRAHIL